MDISVCLVSHNTRDLLRDCLNSLGQHTGRTYEVIVVDNGSKDGSQAMLAEEFPKARLVQNDRNEGFTRPMNQAMRLGAGRYLLLLNPDTVILPAAVDRLADFLDAHPEAGICGPKVLNSDRTLQKPCRRGEPTPWAVISYFTGLSRLFPQSRFFGQYLLNYLDEDQTSPVAGVSGSCMLVRRELAEKLNYLDEIFFAYQEDADFCRRVRDLGMQVIYYPEAQIIHYGGQGGSRIQPYRSIFEWHRSYYRYYRKHLAKNYFVGFNLLFYLVMLVKLAGALTVNFFRTEKYAGARRP